MAPIDLVQLPGGALAGRFCAMASPCEVLVDGADAAEVRALTQLAAVECRRIEAQWSRYRQDNIVHAINTAQGRPVRLDEETARLVEFGHRLHAASDGLFDLSSGVLRRAWRFAPGARPPDARTVTALLERVGWHHVSWRAPVLRLRPGMEIDFGGIGKEYAVDRALACLCERTSRPVLVNFGGDLAASAPRLDGSDWTVGIDSGIAGARAPVIRLARGAVATSGDANRCIEFAGRRYGHILDPRTGWPPPQAPRSVTIAAADCAQAGALATIALLHADRAEAWLRAQAVDGHVMR